MAQKAKNSLSLPSPKLLVFCISFLAVCTYFQLAVGAPLIAPGGSREIDQAEDSDAPPSRVTIARVQSAAQKIVQEDALQNNTSGVTPPPPAVPKSGGRVKKVRGVADSSSSDKNEMRYRGSSAIQDDDSLSPGSASKGKPSKGPSAGKEDAF